MWDRYGWVNARLCVCVFLQVYPYLNCDFQINFGFIPNLNYIIIEYVCVFLFICNGFILQTAGWEVRKREGKRAFLHVSLVYCLYLSPLCLIYSNSFFLCVLLPSLQSTLLCVVASNLSVTTFILLYPSMNPINLHPPAFPPPPSPFVSLSSSSINPVVRLQQTCVVGHTSTLLAHWSEWRKHSCPVLLSWQPSC